MYRSLASLSLAALALLTAPPCTPIAAAQTYEEAVAAFERGDHTTAIREFRVLAEQGNANAQLYLGMTYGIGKGVPENDAAAVKWLRRAAEQGNANAQLYLGMAYDYGEGVPENAAEAVKWYRKAAEQGNANAQLYLGVMYAIGRGVPENDAVAVKWYRKAAEQGNAGAQNDLGMAYANGEGVPENDAEGVSGSVGQPSRGTKWPNATSATCTPTARACRRTTCGLLPG